MPVTVQQGLQALIAGSQGSNPYAEGGEQRKTDKLQALLKGQQSQADVTNAIAKQKGENDTNMQTLQDMQSQGIVNADGSGKAGDLAYGGNPAAKLAMQGPHQAQAFLKTAAGAYKGINDQLDASKATLDALDQGNATSDKLALINEGRLAAGAGGSKAIGKMVDVLSGGKTLGGDYQEKMNWLQNTPNIPTMQPAQRDAIRESVYGRLPQIEQMHQQTSAQLAQQGPLVAPQADTNGLLQSFAGPAQSKLDGLKQMQGKYSQQRAQMQGAPISQQSQANPNPTTLDKLKSFFGGGGTTSPQAGSIAPQPGPAIGMPSSDDIQAEIARRKQAQGQ